ncbi:hypothetical protein [Mangrovicoccus ximenensis]|uniref:hypothetical protein n=1 Tax=Mangrovicoccus ximenensis TaxID=1911570 RepID=UPI001F17FB2E|nr:hypothetical protein [Mangrovicoccus ximenensis]
MKLAIAPAALIALAALAGCNETAGSSSSAASGMPAAGSPSDLSSFEGARAGQAEGGIRALGYELIRTEGLTAYWFNRGTGACARVGPPGPRAGARRPGRTVSAPGCWPRCCSGWRETRQRTASLPLRTGTAA